MGVYRYRRQLAPQQGWVNGVKLNGEIKEHDFHKSTWPIQVSTGRVKQEDDGIFHSHLWLVGKLRSPVMD